MQMQRRGHKFIIAVIACTPVFLWAAGFYMFLKQIPKELNDRLTKTDAIVVLTGGSLRLPAGLELLRDGQAKKLFVSGVHRGVDVQQLLRLARQSPTEIECCIFLGHQADDTTGNAAETAIWLQTYDYKTIRLVTAAYHMPRSILEFRYAIPNAVLIPHPVFPEQVKLREWWYWPGTAGLIFGEYFKYLFTQLRQNIPKIFCDELL